MWQIVTCTRCATPSCKLPKRCSHFARLSPALGSSKDICQYLEDFMRLSLCDDISRQSITREPECSARNLVQYWPQDYLAMRMPDTPKISASATTMQNKVQSNWKALIPMETGNHTTELNHQTKHWMNIEMLTKQRSKLSLLKRRKALFG